MTSREQEPKQPAPMQRTPKGLEIPVPKRSEVMDALRKLIRAKS